MRQYLLIILLLISTLFVRAQEVTFRATSPKVVALGEQFRLTYKLNQKGRNFQAPQMKGFRVLAGPSTSNSSSISIINGRMTKEISQTYTYILQAEKVGKHKIPAAKVNVGNKTYNSNILGIEVVKNNSRKSNQNNRQDNGKSSNVANEDIYLAITANKRSVFLGEPLSLKMKVYTRLNLADLQNPEFPEYKGFYTQKIKTPDNITLKRENINGVIYNTALLNEVLLYPQKTGKLTIESAKIDAIVRKEVQRRRRRSVFDDFFGGQYQQFKIALKSKSFTINVKDLPKEKPKSFTGAVGSFKISSSVDNTELKANDAFTYKIEISGNGNLKLLKDPELNFPHDFDVWDPTISNKITNTRTGSRGSKTYEYVIQARHPGNFTIPEFEFSYFDAQSKKYKTIRTQAYNIKVQASDNTITTLNPAAYSKEDVELIGKDIRYIKTGHLKLKKKQEPFFGTLKYWSFYLGGILIFFIIFLIRRKQIQEASNHILMKNRKAKKEAIKRLKLAKNYLKKDQTEAFYEEIIKGLQGYLSDKLNIPFADLTLDKALEELQKREVSEDLKNQLKDVIQECEFARFAPSQANSDLNSIYTRSIHLISEFENKIKK